LGPEPRSISPMGLKDDAFGVEIDPTLTFTRPELKELLDIWNEKRRGLLMPSRADISPFDFRTHLGHLMIVGVESAPRRFCYRLVGTKITETLQRDVTGRYFEEAYKGPLLVKLTEAFSWVVTERVPLRIYCLKGHPRNPTYAYDCVLLPLSADGETANMVLAELRFTPKRWSRWIINDGRVTDLQSR
jgi:hypothetical protein